VRHRSGSRSTAMDCPSSHRFQQKEREGEQDIDPDQQQSLEPARLPVAAIVRTTNAVPAIANRSRGLTTKLIGCPTNQESSANVPMIDPVIWA
jgi:hypothetical protein